MAKVKLKPKLGLTVRHPKTYKPLDKDGEVVEMNAYWKRRLKDRDVTEMRMADEATTEIKVSPSNQKQSAKAKVKGTR